MPCAVASTTSPVVIQPATCGEANDAVSSLSTRNVTPGSSVHASPPTICRRVATAPLSVLPKISVGSTPKTSRTTRASTADSGAPALNTALGRQPSVSGVNPPSRDRCAGLEITTPPPGRAAITVSHTKRVSA